EIGGIAGIVAALEVEGPHLIALPRTTDRGARFGGKRVAPLGTVRTILRLEQQKDFGVRRQHKREEATVEHAAAHLAVANERLGQGAEGVRRLELEVHLGLEPA